MTGPSRLTLSFALVLSLGTASASEAGDLARAIVAARLLAPPNQSFKIADGPLNGVQDFKTPEAVFGNQYTVQQLNPFWGKSTSRAAAQFFYYSADAVAHTGVNVLFYANEQTARAALSDPDFFPAKAGYIKLQRGRIVLGVADDTKARKAALLLFLKNYVAAHKL